MCTNQSCSKALTGVMDDLDRLSFLVSSKCRNCFLSYIEHLQQGSPQEVELSVRLHKKYCDLLLPYLDQKRKEARDSNRRMAQANMLTQIQSSTTGQQRRRRLDFGEVSS